MMPYCSIMGETNISTHIKVSGIKPPNLKYMHIIQQILQRSGIKDVIVLKLKGGFTLKMKPH